MKNIVSTIMVWLPKPHLQDRSIKKAYTVTESWCLFFRETIWFWRWRLSYYLSMKGYAMVIFK